MGKKLTGHDVCRQLGSRAKLSKVQNVTRCKSVNNQSQTQKRQVGASVNSQAVCTRAGVVGTKDERYAAPKKGNVGPSSVSGECAGEKLNPRSVRFKLGQRGWRAFRAVARACSVVLVRLIVLVGADMIGWRANPSFGGKKMSWCLLRSTSVQSGLLR